jgi:hypothetical protein
MRTMMPHSVGQGSLPAQLSGRARTGTSYAASGPESIPPTRDMRTCVRHPQADSGPEAFGSLHVMPILLMAGSDAHDGVGRLALAWGMAACTRDRRHDGGGGREQDPVAGAVP